MKKILVIFICLLLCGCKTEERHADLNAINNFDFDNSEELNFDIHSKEYMVIRMSDLKVLYEKDIDSKIYPASLTKLMTLDTVLNKVNDLNETSYITAYQVQELINEDASIAYIQTDYDYSIRDLLYALILPSGADGAVAIENYFSDHNMNIIDEMNNQAQRLGCTNSNFVNTTGLHDDNHYTTLNDLFKIVVDILSFKEGRQILETMHYKTEDNMNLLSSLRFVKDDDASVLGGKTGYTPESGQSVMVLFKKNNRSYILFVANAEGNPANEEFYHFIDAMEIIRSLY